MMKAQRSEIQRGTGAYIVNNCAAKYELKFMHKSFKVSNI